MKKDLDSYILTREELRIMKVIWKNGEATVRDVCDAVTRKKRSAYTTIQTHMQILERKGVLSRRKRGKSYLYSPVFSRGQALRNQVDDLLQRFFDGNPESLVKTVLRQQSEVRTQGEAAPGRDSVIYGVRRATSHGNMQ